MKKRIITIIMILTLLLSFIPTAATGFAAGNHLFDGEELVMLTSQSESKAQMMSFLIKTKAGNIIVIDGGYQADGQHLAETIGALGGTVSAWFLTHPHDDHTGALVEIIQNHRLDVDIDNIYYNFPSEDFVARFEPQYLSHIQKINNALDTVADDNKHPNAAKNETIVIDDVKITIMNEKSSRVTNNAVNNTSLVLKVEMGGKVILFLGDLGFEGAAALLQESHAGQLKADIVQMSHHGQAEIGFDIYQAINPEICLWPAPRWLYYNTSKQYTTSTTRVWMEQLGVKTHYISMHGDITLQ